MWWEKNREGVLACIDGAKEGKGSRRWFEVNETRGLEPLTEDGIGLSLIRFFRFLFRVIS